jgi:hypothetical protein
MTTSTRASRTNRTPERQNYLNWLERHNTSILADRAALIAKITSLQPTIKEDKLTFLAAEHGNLGLEGVLDACEKIASLI